jgi:PAS domain S-box-containing protein
MRNDFKTVSIEEADEPALRRLLQFAIGQGHVWPAFQPIVDIRTGTIASFEILARWGNSSVGDISPMTFIPCLERHGLIDTLSDALIMRGCREAEGWPGQFSLAFNISPIQLTNENFPRHLADIVATTGFPLERVELEVTEASLISDNDLAYRILRELNDLGVKIGIDDFGTGYSNLARLEAFPFSKLKIDARFVRDIHSCSGKRRIAAAIIGLGQSLGITVVAEGVETVAEETILRSLGCDLGQGWLYGKGAPDAEAHEVLTSRSSVNGATCPLDASPFQQLHQLANLYEKAPVGLCFVDMDFRHVRTNDRFASIHGMIGAEIEGKTIYDVMECEPLQTTIGLLTDAAATDQPVLRDYVLRGRNVQVTAARVHDIAGDIIGFSVVAIDVTDENRLKATLVESERRLRKELDFADAIINSLPGMFYYYDADFRLQRLNKNAERLTGYTADELRNMHPLEFYGKEDRDRLASGIRQAITTGYAQVDAVYLTKDGRAVPYLLTAARLEADGKAGFVGVATDMSELRKVRRALQERTAVFEAMLHTTPDGILVVDQDGKRLIQNKRMNELWNIPEDMAANPDVRTQLEFCVGQVKKPEDFADRIAWLKAHPEENSVENLELADGSILGCHTMPLRDSEGHYYGRVWAFRKAA